MTTSRRVRFETAALEADGVADRAADLLAEQPGHVAGGIGRRQPARLEQHDPLTVQPGGIQQGQRDAGGLARAGGSDQHGAAVRLQGGGQLGEDGFDRKWGGTVTWRAFCHSPRRNPRDESIAGCLRGSRMRTVVPTPGALSMMIWPWWASTRYLTMVIPRPVPGMS